MGKISKTIFGIIFSTLFLSLIIAFVNFKTERRYKVLCKYDLIAQALVRVKTQIQVTNISSLFVKSEVIRKRTDFIVIHCDAIENQTDYVPAFDIEKYHLSKGFKHFAYTYYISKAGTIYQMHNEHEKTNHAGGKINYFSVSVCLQGNFDKEIFEETQKKQLVKLLFKLKKQFPNAQIIGHCAVSEKTCPGTNVNLNEINSIVNYLLTI